MDIYSALSVVFTFCLYVGSIFAAGTVFYSMAFISNDQKPFFQRSTLPESGVVTFFAILGVASAIFIYLLQAANLAGSFVGALDADILNILWQTSNGTALILRVVGFSLLLIGCLLFRYYQAIPGSLTLIGMCIGACIALTSFVLIGHVTTLSGVLTPAILLIHLIGVSLWVGVLLPLYRSSSDNKKEEEKLDRKAAEAAKIGHKFGRFAVFFVPILVLAGGWLAYQLIGSFQGLFTTQYGLIVLLKVAAVASLLGLAANNKLRLVPELRSNNIDVRSKTLTKLRKSVFFELVLVAVIMLITAILTNFVALPK